MIDEPQSSCEFSTCSAQRTMKKPSSFSSASTATTVSSESLASSTASPKKKSKSRRRSSSDGRRQVAFHRRVKIRPIPMIQSLDDLESCWYNDNELNAMRDREKKIGKQLKKRWVMNSSNNNADTVDGMKELGFLTYEDRLARQQRQLKAMEAVFLEQEQQWESSGMSFSSSASSAEEAIAYRYAKECERPSRAALERGMVNATMVRKERLKRSTNGSSNSLVSRARQSFTNTKRNSMLSAFS